jgi:hypothetical protein
MISKEEFVKVINALKNADDLDNLLYNKTNRAISLFELEEYSGLQNAIVFLLEKMFNLEVDSRFGSDISYFIYDLEFGKNWTSNSITIDGVSIDISTPEKLYDYLIEREKL